MADFTSPSRITDYLNKSITGWKEMNPDVVIRIHYSGVKFIQAMREQMPDRLALSTNRTEFLLGVELDGLAAVLSEFMR